MNKITDYDEAEEKTQIVIDYFARHRVVPRKYDYSEIPDSWDAVSRKDVKEGIQKEFQKTVSESLPGWVWERLGANHDVVGAIEFLQGRREDFLDAGLHELAAWNK